MCRHGATSNETSSLLSVAHPNDKYCCFDGSWFRSLDWKFKGINCYLENQYALPLLYTWDWVRCLVSCSMLLLGYPHTLANILLKVMDVKSCCQEQIFHLIEFYAATNLRLRHFCRFYSYFIYNVFGLLWNCKPKKYLLLCVCLCVSPINRYPAFVYVFW